MNERMKDMSENKISAIDIEEIIKKDIEAGNNVPHNTFEWCNGVTVDVVHSVPFATELAIIEAMVQSCFDEDGNYFPVLADMMYRHEVIAKYTNIELPEDVEVCYALFYNTDLWLRVSEYIDDVQLRNIQNAAYEMIYQRNDMRAESLKKSVESMVENFSKITDALDGISAADISGMFSAFANGDIDESKIVNAILTQNKEASK